MKTVAQLIAELQAFPPDMPVVVLIGQEFADPEMVRCSVHYDENGEPLRVREARRRGVVKRVQGLLL